jgi:hypothetical protein
MLTFPHAMAVDAAGNAYLTGENDSPDFPGAASLPPQPNGAINTFIAKIAGSPPRGPAATLYAGIDSVGKRSQARHLGE